MDNFSLIEFNYSIYWNVLELIVVYREDLEYSENSFNNYTFWKRQPTVAKTFWHYAFKKQNKTLLIWITHHFPHHLDP